ncbi:MAG: Vms1/Ankzf1 family peptidyl-tRNA hydrolase [Methanosarcina sp.]|nr:Vms1/Ankzf1 family peptidyl-tRNA hydrolase [Methanosarcina sp.]MDD4306271.1 Vms1/Ankzf1 family peptidyl-tRNA hydrolase [Methanosarcina sp.]MDD4620915.1 Vms1/Ankzf1 family peptidyl-tRNA hydrolase [Methanosarcina sp.]
MNNKKAKKEATEVTKKGLSTFIGKISGKGQLELEVDRLNSQIVKLELDLRSAKNQLEKKETLARQAVADRQEAEVLLNQERIRTQTLSHELEAIRTESEGKLKFRGIETLSPQAVQAYLSKLKSFHASAGDLLTVYLPPDTRLSGVLSEKVLELVGEETRTLLDRLDPETGLVLFYDLHRMVCEAIAPPIPINSPAWQLGHSFEVSLLEENLSKDYRMLVLVLHAGESFIGFAPDGRVFEIDELIRSSVKEKHSKGGFSQRRFERLREEDIAHHMDKVVEALDKVLEENKFIDYVFLSGDFQLIGEVRKRLPLNLEIIEKPSDIRVEKTDGEDILRTVLSSRRYLL